MTDQKLVEHIKQTQRGSDAQPAETGSPTLDPATFIKQAYMEILGREPLQGELDSYVRSLNNGITEAAIVRELRRSAERQIRTIYLRYLNREPDMAGREYWTLKLAEGMSLREITIEFVSSTEYFVRQLYLRYLNREPDMAGLEYWIAEIDQGKMTRQQVQNQFQNLEEGTEAPAAQEGTFSAEEKIRNAYQLYLHRAPDAEGLMFWLGLVESGEASLNEVIESIRQSHESFVRNLYLNLLGREADRAGLEYWILRLQQGLTPAHTGHQWPCYVY